MSEKKQSFLDRRRAGVLLHPTSLPSGEIPGGDMVNEYIPGHVQGSLGVSAFRFIDFLVDSGFSVWQVLPLVPTHDDGSPYNGMSSHAGNALLINLDLLIEEGLLTPASDELNSSDYRVFHDAQLRVAKNNYFEMASENDLELYDCFLRTHVKWLPDYALYDALKLKYKTTWTDWPEQWRDRKITADEIGKTKHPDLYADMQQCFFEQFIFFRQWNAIKEYANQRDVLLFGDIPIFVAHDSAEVWARREQFRLDSNGYPDVVAGVPPDYFSVTGQRWGNPLYNWELMQQEKFSWWIDRIKTQLELYDLIRIDHFRGFEAYWEIDAECETALDGHWVEAPGDELFQTLFDTFDDLPIIAEDLGLITTEVTAMRERYCFPGMKILQFAYDGGPDNPYLPENHQVNSVVYTGTHDNDTTLGWFNSLSTEMQLHVVSSLDDNSSDSVDDADMPWRMMRVATESNAELAILPMQDVLALGSDARMNSPGTISENNWQWQFSWSQLETGVEEKLKALLTRTTRV